MDWIAVYRIDINLFVVVENAIPPKGSCSYDMSVG
jgi:hypothetical protein